jgi:hypothetical protein
MYQRSKIMTHCFRTIAALAVSLMGSVLVPALQADEWNKKTNIKIDQSIDVQGTVLPAGSYVMKLLLDSDRRTVEIYNADDNRLITTVLAIPAYRPDAGNSEFKFYGATEGRPPALRTWFYPGDNFGFEFRSGQGVVAAQSGPRLPNSTTSSAGGN